MLAADLRVLRWVPDSRLRGFRDDSYSFFQKNVVSQKPPPGHIA